MVYAKIFATDKEDVFGISFYGNDEEMDKLEIGENGIENMSSEEVYDYLATNEFIPSGKLFYKK